MDIDFIKSNPAIDEFNRANKIADDRDTQTLRNRGQELQNSTAQFNLQQSQQQAPTKLRLLNAQADTATTGAQAAAAKAPYAGPQAAADLQRTRATIAEMNVRTAAIHMDAYSKEIALIEQGDVEGARRLAASVGDKLDEGLVTNAQLRGAVKNVVAQATTTYPGRPKDQMTFIAAHLHTLADQAQNKQPINPQTAPFQQVPGAPTPQETSAVGASGETERIIANVRQENPNLSYADAVGIAKRAPNGDTVQLRKETLALTAARADPNFNNDPNATLATWRQKYGLGAMGAPAAAGNAPAAAAPAAPAVPQRPQGVPPGSMYSPSRQMWKGPDGTIYGADGKVTQPAYPTLPQSQ